MALQGDIKSIAFADVLRLLADTGKTGRITLTGDRGDGQVWLRDGGIVGADASAAPHAEAPVDVMFELMRFQYGAFRYDEAVVEAHGEPAVMGEVLSEASAMLAEFRAIELVVPSQDVWVTFAAELDRDQVVVSRDEWRVLGALAGGCTIRQLGDRVTMTELAICRMASDLVGAGLMTVDEDAPAGARQPDPASPVEAETAEDEPASPAVSVLRSVPDETRIDDADDLGGAAELPVEGFDDHQAADGSSVFDVTADDVAGDDVADADEAEVTFVGFAPSVGDPSARASAFLPEPLPVAGSTSFTLAGSGAPPVVHLVDQLDGAGAHVGSGQVAGDASDEVAGSPDAEVSDGLRFPAGQPLDVRGPMTDPAERPAALADFLGSPSSFDAPSTFGGSEPAGLTAEPAEQDWWSPADQGPDRSPDHAMAAVDDGAQDHSASGSTPAGAFELDAVGPGGAASADAPMSFEEFAGFDHAAVGEPGSAAHHFDAPSGTDERPAVEGSEVPGTFAGFGGTAERERFDGSDAPVASEPFAGYDGGDPGPAAEVDEPRFAPFAGFSDTDRDAGAAEPAFAPFAGFSNEDRVAGAAEPAVFEPFAPYGDADRGAVAHVAEPEELGPYREPAARQANGFDAEPAHDGPPARSSLVRFLSSAKRS